MTRRRALRPEEFDTKDTRDTKITKARLARIRSKALASGSNRRAAGAPFVPLVSFVSPFQRRLSWVPAFAG